MGLRAAEALDDAGARFRVGIQLGRALYETRRFAEAHQVLDATLEVVTEPLDRATTLEFIGRAHLDAGEPARAIGYFHQARDLEEANGRVRGVAINLHHLARAHLMLDAEDEAMACLSRAHEIFASIPDPYNQGRVLHTLGVLHLRARRTGPAADALGKALESMRDESRTYQVGQISESLAELAALTGDATGERRHREAAITAYEQVGSARAAELRTEPDSP